MTTIKKPTNINKRRHSIGKLYRAFEDDIWGRLIYKNLYFKTRYQFLFGQQGDNKLLKTAYTNMQKIWQIIKTKQFVSSIRHSWWEREKQNILRLDIINPKKVRKRMSYKVLTTMDAKRFKYFYHNIPVKQLKKIIKSYKALYINKYKIFLFLLESRLDIILYRIHMVSTISEGRQYINHCKITVNNKIVNKPNFVLKFGDIVSCIYEYRGMFQKNILRRLLPLNHSELLYYYPCYLEVNYRVLSATVVGNIIHKFEENWIPYFSSIDPIAGFVYYSYKNK